MMICYQVFLSLHCMGESGFARSLLPGLTLRLDSECCPRTTIPSGTSHTTEWSGYTDVARHAAVNQTFPHMRKDDM
jgi:hypothetical protein